MRGYIQVSTATRTREDAEKIAHALVKKRLAACVQILGPISSTYWWKNRIENVEEYLCLIKSQKSLYGRIEKAIKEIHPYETPEFTATSIVAGSKEYFKWIDQELKSES